MIEIKKGKIYLSIRSEYKKENTKMKLIQYKTPVKCPKCKVGLIELYNRDIVGSTKQWNFEIEEWVNHRENRTILLCPKCYKQYYLE